MNRRAFAGALLAGIAVGVCALISAPALALSTHVPSGSFGSAGSGAGELSSPDGVAFNTTTHDLFIADRGNARVDEFSSTGAFVRAWGWGVADGMPTLETCTLTCEQGLSGAGAGELTTPSFIAVDNSAGPSAGDVYVADTGDGSISKFTAAGALVESWGAHGQLSGATADKGPFGEIAGIAVDAQGTLLVLNTSSVLFEYAQGGAFAEDFAVQRGTSANGLAVNAQGAFFKVNGEPSVEEQTGAEAGGDVGQLTRSASTTGLAVDSSTSDLYVAEGGQVGHYESAGPGLVRETGGGSCVVEPERGCLATDSFGAMTLSASTGIAVDPADSEVYVADASAGEIYTFVPGVLPDVSTGAASNVTSVSATIGGSVDPDGIATTYQFEYGMGASFGSVAPATPATVGSDSTVHQLTANLAALTPGSTYHYRIVASNANGTNYGEVKTFATTGPPTIDAAFVEGVGLASAKLHATVDPHGLDTHLYVEYGTSTGYGSRTAPLDLGAEGESVQAEASITGLRPNTAYHFRLVTENEAGIAYNVDDTFTTKAIVEGESFQAVGATTAKLRADIDPGGQATSYHVEYGTDTAYGSVTPTIEVGAGETRVAVAAVLEGLEPGISYHFRFVAVKAGATETGADVIFTTHTLSPPGLPDDRGYEMVTPVDNEGAEPYFPFGDLTEGESAIFTKYPSVAAADGEAVAYAGVPISSGNSSQGGGSGNEFLAKRNPGGGWTQDDIQPAGYRSPTYWGFSNDLEDGILQSSEALTPGAPAGYRDLYVRNDDDGSYQPLSNGMPPSRSASEFGAASSTGFVGEKSLGEHYAGASADFTHLLFEANDALTAEAGADPPGKAENDLYESVNGELRLVNVLPASEGGMVAPGASFGGPAQPNYETPDDFSHAIAANGARIFWTDASTGALYVRENGASTSLIAKEATYLTASADGSKVLYTKAGDLYENDLDTGVTSAITSGGQVLGIAGAGDDLEYVYFVAQAALSSGAVAGRSNLYVLHDGSVRFIAALGSRSEEEAEFLGFEVYPWQSDIGWRDAEVTPSGEDLVFMSTKSLTGYDNVSESGGSETIAESEVYVYDASDAQISCVSCDPTGQPPAALGSDGAARVGGALAISRHATYQERVISDDGDRVFFESAHPLVPQAQDGRINVYEWERDGDGSCGYANGCIYLLSSGSSSTASYFIDASASGNDVFMMTRSQLVPADKNEYNDIYDARVGAVEAPGPPQCTGTGCQGVPAAPPVFATPASATFNGVGNFSPVANSVSKPKAKPRKKTQGCSAKKKQRGAGKAAERAHVKPVRCKAKKAAKPARRKSERGGR